MKQFLLLTIALCLATIALAQPPAVYYTTENARCFGSADGAIVLNINGGLPPYHYTVNGGPTTILNQPGGWQWAASAGGSSNADAAWQVVVDDAGNSFVTGAFSGTVNFGTATVTAVGGTDVFLAKYDPSGVLAWVRRAGGNGDDKALTMALTSTGELYLAGAFQGLANFGSVAVNAVGTDDLFLARYNANGSVAWVKQAQGIALEEGLSVTVNDLGEVALTGAFTETATFGALTLQSLNARDIFLVRYNAAGVPLWAQRYGGFGDDLAAAVHWGNAGSLYLTGTFAGTLALGSGWLLTASGSTDAFLARLDGQGNPLLVKQLGSLGFDAGVQIKTDVDGAIYATGTFEQSLTVEGITVHATGHQDIFLARFRANGNLDWLRKTGGAEQDVVSDLAVDADGDVFMVGGFRGTLLAGSQARGSAGGEDIFLSKHDALGRLLWVETLGGTGDDQGRSVALSMAGDPHLAASFEGMVHFGGQSVNSAGNADIAVAVLGDPSVYDTIACLPAGTYQFQVGDLNQALPVANIAVDQPDALLVSSVVNPVSCHGGQDGSVIVLADGGTAPYQYAWSTGETAAAIVGVPAGTYGLTITDARQCDQAMTFEVEEPTSLSGAVTSLRNVSCHGGNDGYMLVDISGGQPPYQYAWNDGQTTAMATGLRAGVYTATITDAGNNCLITSTATITEPLPLSTEVRSVLDATCYGEADGQAWVGAAGGTAPYQFAWSHGATGELARELAADLYVVSVTDELGCEALLPVTVDQPVAIIAGLESTDPTWVDPNSGSAVVTILGGTPPFRYAWSNGQSGTAITRVAAGDYGVTVTDARGCAESRSVKIRQGFSVFPNPAREQLQVTINLEEAGEVAISLLNLSGQPVFQRLTSGPAGPLTRTFNVSRLLAGPYYLRVTTEQGTLTRQVVIVP